MELDIRLAIGFMFSILGLILTVFGLVTASDAEMYAQSLAVNINLWSGLLMLVFGGLMLFFGFRSRKKPQQNV
jgi:hypothetical protein